MPSQPPQAPWAAIDARIAADPTRPLLTCYLDPPSAGPGAGEADRIDLTGTTWSTWVAKTVNLLLELGALEPAGGAEVLLRLPSHWQTAVWTEAALRIGARVRVDPADAPVPDPGAAPGGARPLVVAYERRSELAACTVDDAEERFFLPLLPMNAPGALPELSARIGSWNYSAEVNVFGDRYELAPAVREQAAATARLAAAGLRGAAGLGGGELVAAADARAAAAGLADGGRLLATGHRPGGPWLELLAAARRGGSLVLAPDAASLEHDRAARRWSAERVTAAAAGLLPGAGAAP